MSWPCLQRPTGTPRRSEAAKSVWLPSPAATHMMEKHTAAVCYISLLAPVPAVEQAATTCCIASWNAHGHSWDTQLKQPCMPRTMCAVAAPARSLPRVQALFSLMSTPGQPRTRRPHIGYLQAGIWHAHEISPGNSGAWQPGTQTRQACMRSRPTLAGTSA